MREVVHRNDAVNHGVSSFESSVRRNNRYFFICCKQMRLLRFTGHFPQMPRYNISINKAGIISYVSFNAPRSFGIIGVYKISHKSSPRSFTMTRFRRPAKIAQRDLFYFRISTGEKARKVCTIVTRGAYTSQSPTDLHCSANSFSNRSRARCIRAYVHSYGGYVSPFADRRCTTGSCGSSICIRNWFAPDTGLAIE